MLKPHLTMLLAAALSIFSLISHAADEGAENKEAEGEKAKSAEAPAEEKAAEAKEMNPAEKILRTAADFIAKQKQLSYTTVVNVVTGQGEQIEKMNMTSSIAAKDPNLYRNDIVSDDQKLSLICDGTNAYIYMPDRKEYMQLPAPPSVSAFADDPRLAGGGGLMSLPVVMLSEDPYARLTQGAEKMTLKGEEKVNDTLCDRIILEQKMVDINIWIAKGDKPLILQLVPDVTKMMEAMAKQNPQATGLKQDIKISFTDWKLEPKFAEDKFTFTPGEEDKKVDQFSEEQKPSAAEVLPGKDAPDFELKNLKGESVKLSDYAGKKVVILDFWATWCGPCKMAMPILQSVAKDYAEKDVVLLGVNQGEDADTIKTFLDANELEISTVLDANGAVGEKYMVPSSGIPLTVVVGKDGKIKKAHVGFAPDLKIALSNELNEILNGKGETPEPDKKETKTE